MEVLLSVVGKEKKRERFDTILEPLQAITQLAILAFHLWAAFIDLSM